MNETVPVPGGVPQVSTDLLRRGFARQTAGFASAVSRVRCAQDPEAVHDLRGSARALDAMLRMWAGLLDSRPRRVALRALRRLRHRLGKARELEAHIALLEATAAPGGDPVLSLVERMRWKLRRRTVRAARRLGPRRLRTLMGRIEAASTSLRAGRAHDLRTFDHARAYLLERRAMARIAVELALTREDDGLLRRARLAINQWRHALECVSGAWADGPDPGPALNRLEEILGAIQDRGTLIGAIERHRRDGERPGFEAVLGQLRADKQAAFARFRALATAHGAHAAGRVTTAPGPRVVRGPVHEAAHPAPGSTGERWERMAQWLLEKGRAR